MISYTLTQNDIDQFTANNLELLRNNVLAQVGTVISSGNALTFRIKSNASLIMSIGWVFTTGTTRVTQPFAVSTDKKSATNTMDSLNRTYLEFVITMTENKFFTIGESDLNSCALKHYDIYVNNVKAGLGDNVYNGDTVALKTKDSYLFTGNQYIGRKHASGTDSNIIFTNTSSTVVTKSNVHSVS